VDVNEHIAQLREHGIRLAEAARAAAPATAVPTCPGWSLADLVRHTGAVHRWASDAVGTPDPTPRGDRAYDEALETAPTTYPQLVEWYVEAHAKLVATLTAADPDGDCWHFLPAPSGTAFWARRQAHEAAIHATDADLAVGLEPLIDPAFAADGLDELMLFAIRRRRGLTADPPWRLLLQASDAMACWLVAASPDGCEVGREPRQADCVVEGPVADLYLLAWNRRSRAGLRVRGDESLLDLWRASVTVTWS